MKLNKPTKIKPQAPLCRVIKEGTLGDFAICGSTTIKRFVLLGPKIGCINPECKNYYKKEIY